MLFVIWLICRFIDVFGCFLPMFLNSVPGIFIKMAMFSVLNISICPTQPLDNGTSNGVETLGENNRRHE